MVRLSYQRLPNGNYVSNLIPLQTMLIFVMIHTDKLTYDIRYVNNDTVGMLADEHVSYRNIKNLKQAVRGELKRIGVVFKDEIRKKV